MKKTPKKVAKKKVIKAKKEEMLYVVGYITKGKDKGKYVAVQVRNTQIMNPVEPIFEVNKGMEYVVVGKDERKVREIFSKILQIEKATLKIK